MLLVTPHVFAGGAEKAVLNLAWQLMTLNCEVSVATLSLDLTKLPTRFAQLNYIVPQKQIDQSRLKGLPSVLWSSSKELLQQRQQLRRYAWDFDVVMVGNFPSYWAAWLAHLSAASNRARPVWFSSEVLAPYNQTQDLYTHSLPFRVAFRLAVAFDRWLVRRTFPLIVSCSTLNNRLIKARYGRKSLVLPTGVDYEFFHQTVPEAKARLGLDKNVVLLQVGALVKRKNQIVSIRALQILKQRLGPAKLVLVGEGPMLPLLEAEVQKLGLKNDVVFAGGVSEDKLRLLYHACDINLYPGRDQTWGLVPFEALAAGKPSVVARDAGAAEVIGRENIGLLTEADAEAVANAVLFVLEHQQWASDAVARGQRYVEQNLTWAKYGRGFFDVFEKFLAQKN